MVITLKQPPTGLRRDNDAVRRRLGFSAAMLLLWLLIAIMMIAVALILSRCTPSTCMKSPATVCTHPAVTHRSLNVQN